MNKLTACAVLFCAFVPALPAAVPLPSGASYEIAFAPRGGALELVLSAINSARFSINVAAYGFTSKPISAALLAAHRRGVKVALVADAKSNSRSYTAATFLANQGVAVRLNDRFAILHNKFMVVDGIHVETGSFNYTASAANKNAENVLVLWNAKPLAAAYLQDWQKLWNGGRDLTPRY